MGKLTKTYLIVFSSLLSTVILAQDDSHPVFWQDLAAADNEFSQAATERGRTEAFLEFLGESSILFREGRPVDARELYERSAASYRLDQLSWRAHFIDVSRDGDLGFTVGPNAFTSIQEEQEEGERQQNYSHVINVWHKVNGDWKLMLDMFARVPGFLSMDVGPDYRDTQRVLAETAPPEMTRDIDMASLIEADNRHAISINFRGGQRALLRYGLENQRVYLPGMAPGIGAESASTAYGRFLDNRVATTNPIVSTYLGGYLSTSRELGYTYGEMTTTEMQGRPGFRANYLRIWRFSTSNEWRIAMEFLSEF